MEREHCQHTKSDGQPCRARPLVGSDYCFFHDPAKAAEREAAQRAGGLRGKAAVLPADMPARRIENAADVIGLLAETINQVRTGALDPRVGNCVGYLSGIVLKAHEQGELAERLAALEAAVKVQGPQESLFDADPADPPVGEEDGGEPWRATA